MKRSLFKLAGITLPVTLGLFTASNAFGGTILYDTLLANPSFEAGNQASGCPVGWTCGGVPSPGFTSYLVTAAQFTPGLDGLSGGAIVPDGSHAASSPVPSEGSGTLSQTGLGIYTNNTYTLNLWIGTPMTLPTDNTTPVSPVGTIKIDFLGNGGVALATLNAIVPTVGIWDLEQFSFTPISSQIGQTIGLEIEVVGQPPAGGSAANRIVNFDIVPSTIITPEPASLGLMGLGLIGLGLVSRRFKRN